MWVCVARGFEGPMEGRRRSMRLWRFREECRSAASAGEKSGSWASADIDGDFVYDARGEPASAEEEEGAVAEGAEVEVVVLVGATATGAGVLGYRLADEAVTRLAAREAALPMAKCC